MSTHELHELSMDPPHLAARDARIARPIRDSGHPEGSPCGCAPNPAWVGARTPRIHDLTTDPC